MKLHKTHLFLLLIAVLVLSTLGFTVKEYFENKDSPSEEAMDDMKQENVDPNPDPALDKGSKYDPFGNSSDSSETSQDDGNYQSIISDLEDIVVPGRRSRKHHHDNQKHHKHGRHGERRRENRQEHLEKEVERQERKMARDAGVDMSKYILKSEIVPPVCPKCPDSKTCPALARQKPCPACPPCGRCPEPAFECKKVPNYSAISAANAGNLLPMPRLNSFASFN